MQVSETVCMHGVYEGMSVAIKAAHADDPVATKALGDERAIHNLLGQHPHVMRLLDTLHGLHGVEGLVLALCEGGTLHHHAGVNRLRAARSGRKPYRRLSAYLRNFQQATDALAYIHDKGVVHGDLKGDNILLTADGQVVVGDFGVSHKAGTWVAGYRGTAPYIAPEVLSWHLSEKKYFVDPTQDMFSLGATFFELLCPEPITRMFQAPPGYDKMSPEQQADARCEYHWDIAQDVYQDLHGHAAELAGLQEGLADSPHLCELLDILQGCLRLDPEARTTAATLHDKIRELLKRVEVAEQVRSMISTVLLRTVRAV